MEELLVVFACLNSTGCKETSKHYYNTHSKVQEIVKNSEDLVKDYVGPVVIESIGPVLIFSTGGTGIVRINQKFSLQINRDHSILWLSKEF